MSYSSPESISSGDEPTNTNYDVWKGTLRQCLKGIKSVGDFASFTRYTSFTNPALKIEGHPAFPLPLTPGHAELIKAACKQAPFGKGDDTLVDTSVRNTWELEHSQFELLNPEWSAFLVKVGTGSAGGLGLMNISLKPHKLLLYEKGSFFKRHKDTEKEPGMVGTLVVCLPSEHLGGDVHLSFGSDERSFSTAPTSRFDLTALAWYSDVSHEVKELEAGYRLALTYNIVQNGSKKQSAGFFGQQAQQIKKILLEWQRLFPEKNTLIHRLEHKYSEASLSMRNTKGRDGAVCRALHQVASECGVYLLFAQLTRSEKGAEPDYYGYGGDDEEDTYNDMKTLYSYDGKPVGFGGMPDDEEVLDLSKLSEGNPDSEDEGEFTGNEGAESTYRYHNTVAVLVKKKSVHRYMSQVPHYGSSKNSYTENMVQMVADDMAKFMQDQTVNEHARPPVLEVIRKALGSGGSSKAITPIAVYWALTLEDRKLYRSAMAAAAKSGIQDIHNSAIKTACDFIEERFGNNPESIEWDKWVGNVAEADTVASVQRIIQDFTPVFTNNVVRDSFVKWGESKLSDKFKTQASFDIGEHLFFVKTTGEKHDQKEWLMSSLIPALASRGTRALIYGVLRFVFVKRDQVEFAIAKELFEYVLHHAFPRLLLQGADMLPKPAGSGPSNRGPPTRDPPTRDPPPCSGPLKDFVDLVDQCLTLGLVEKRKELLEACCNQLVWTKAEWHPKKVGGDVVPQLLQPIIKTLKEHSIPATQGVKDLFEVILREGLYANVPQNPPKRRGWTHKPRACPNNYGGLGHKCRDCEAMNAFLVAPDQKVWRYQAGKQTRDHLESQLRADSSGSGYGSGYAFGSRAQYFNIKTEKTQRTHTMVVEKTGREFAEAVESWQHIVWALDSRLMPLRDEMVAEMLGDEVYRELVLLENLLAQIPAGTKRPADETATGDRHGVKRVRL
ncbi:uncharacterized protein ColSpa_02700 [Colletotrichum spaethianum]|uniref:Prolyl 4-hydroxylase alpha subunit Fe(2+) 2OG dioxygenase domain-containing protein n=1 Tax=Colletotrichum spaethianum TaxID=700344 RepID=A0AA37L8B7_9PEZI|nr:uncharacterized protein ColSpa_02700 [Colletotrichum spaethianum]GKT42519.1 hypothetical protein ColSpa_02700 [Colletotrichum spaethianum]